MELYGRAKYFFCICWTIKKPSIPVFLLYLSYLSYDYTCNDELRRLTFDHGHCFQLYHMMALKAMWTSPRRATLFRTYAKYDAVDANFTAKLKDVRIQHNF